MSELKKIGLFGFGAVGKGFYQILHQGANRLAEVSKVCVKRLDLERINHELYFTTDASEILEDPEITIVIEVISDPVAAKQIVHQALKAGKSVISANKKMIGESLIEIDDWHQEYAGSFLYEAAVGGGIPIVRNVDSLFRMQGVIKIRGILNGSSNYILTQMQQNGWSFDRALADAQKKGFAEENPSLDIDGLDASYKLAILGYHAFDEVMPVNSCEIRSIRSISEQEIRKAKKENKKIKQVASIEKNGHGYKCSILPEWVSSTDELYNVDMEYNAISITTSTSGKHVAVGKGAGSLPTGSAVISDLSRLLAGESYSKKSVRSVLT